MKSRQEKAMTLKSRMSNVVNEIQQQTEGLSARLDQAKNDLAHWGHRTQRLVRRNPATAIFGAFVLGFALAKVARHA
jgi:ElaB/YqjD/DUF883 family membrane-anchored ribosome-binding protein